MSRFQRMGRPGLTLAVLLLPALALADYAQNGPLTWTQTSQSVMYLGKAYTYDLYVPNAAGPFPIVAVGHGFNLVSADMAGYGKLFASRGNIVAIPNFGSFNSDHAGNAQVMLAAIDQVVALGAPGQSLAGLVDGARQAVAGHSAGGLSAFLAAAARPGLRAVILLDAVDTTVGTAQAPNVVAPVLFLFADPSSCNTQNNSTAWYAPVGSPSKARMNVVAAAHCDPQDPIDPNCSVFCGGAHPDKTPYFKRYASGWLQYFMSCELAAREAIDGAAFSADFMAGALSGAAFVNIALPAACASSADAGTPDAGPVDAGPVDAGPVDAGLVDAGPTDAGLVDGGAMDAGATGVDSGVRDAGVLDAGGGLLDAGAGDAGPADAGAGVGAGDAGGTAGTDSGTTDAGSADGGARPDAGSGMNPDARGCGCGGAGADLVAAALAAIVLASQRRRSTRRKRSAPSIFRR